jgi:hypothetical protein
MAAQLRSSGVHSTLVPGKLVRITFCNSKKLAGNALQWLGPTYQGIVYLYRR